MSHELTASLMRMVKESIERLQSSTAFVPDNRVLTRALAHLWSAHDEIELLGRDRPTSGSTH